MTIDAAKCRLTADEERTLVEAHRSGGYLHAAGRALLAAEQHVLWAWVPESETGLAQLTRAGCLLAQALLDRDEERAARTGEL